MAQIKNVLNEIKNIEVASAQEAYEVVKQALSRNGLTAVPSMEQAEKAIKAYDLPMPYGVQRGEDSYMTLEGEENGDWQPTYEVKVTELYSDAGMDNEDYLFLIHVEER